jgi:hypothetical protein
LTGQNGHEEDNSVHYLRVHESLGGTVFQLYARKGRLFRKNFSIRTEAEAERQIQESNWLRRDTGPRVAFAD